MKTLFLPFFFYFSLFSYGNENKILENKFPETPFSFHFLGKDTLLYTGIDYISVKNDLDTNRKLVGPEVGLGKEFHLQDPVNLYYFSTTSILALSHLTGSEQFAAHHEDEFHISSIKLKQSINYNFTIEQLRYQVYLLASVGQGRSQIKKMETKKNNRTMSWEWGGGINIKYTPQKLFLFFQLARHNFPNKDFGEDGLMGITYLTGVGVQF